jgi:hypothetical protein
MSANAGATLSSDPVAFYIADKSLSPGLVAGQLCRAWVNFDGTGTVAIRASYNVSSITDNGTGDYTVNFTTALVDANYNVTFGVNDNKNTSVNWAAVFNGSSGGTDPTATAVRVCTNNTASAPSDIDFVFVAIFR